MDANTLNKMWVLRKVLNPLSTVEQMEFLIEKLRATKTNQDFIMSMNK